MALSLKALPTPDSKESGVFIYRDVMYAAEGMDAVSGVSQNGSAVKEYVAEGMDAVSDTLQGGR